MSANRIGRSCIALLLAAAPLTAERPELGEVAVVGQGDTNLLAIPCASCRWRSFDEFAERNSERFTTVAVTLPGYGGTSPPDLPTFGSDPIWHDHAVRALASLLEQRDLRDVIVVGHSFGASIALQLADRSGDRIRGLVNLDGTLVGPLERGAMTAAERLEAARTVRVEYMDPLADPDEWQRFNLPSIARPDRRILYHGWFMATDRTAAMQYWWENLLVDRNPILRRLEMPVLDVQLFSASGPATAKSRARYQARVDALDLGPNYSVVYYEGIGHFLMEDAPEVLDDLLAAFVARITGHPAADGQ